MCGRFTLATPSEILAALFGVDTDDWNVPRFNIAPRTRIVTIRHRQGRRLGQSLIWGAANPRDSRCLINARSETAATSPFFGPGFSNSRLLIPADGFFEWTRDGTRRMGRYFQGPDRGPFAFAGLAVEPVGPPVEKESTTGAVILTTQASPSVRPYHDRMPLIIRPESFDVWLAAGTKPQMLRELVASGPQTSWTSYPVGPLVNNVRNDTPENVRPLKESGAPAQRRLF